MRNKFLKPNDLLLTKIAKEISISKISSKEIQEIIYKMLNVATGEQKDNKKPIMVGLAAPQIGISKRIILVDVAANGKGPLRPRSEASKVGTLRVYINPKIIWTSKQKGEWYEGCYSTSKVCGIVSRPTSIKIQFITQDGELIQEKHTGYVARIFQHEIDHLNGIRFPDKISDPNKLHWVEKKEFPLYRDKQAWKTWPKLCSFERWQRLKKPLLK